METLSVFEASRNAVMISLQDLWIRFFGFLPVLIGAILVLVIGWLVAVAVGKLVTRVLRAVKLNEAFDKLSGLRSSLQKAGMGLNPARFVGAVVKWFIIIVTLMATSDILGLAGVTLFLNQIIAYVPNIVVAIVMIIAGTLFANFVQKITRASAAAARLPHRNAAAAVAKWAVLVFTFIATLVQLGVAEVLLQTFFTGFVATIAIAGGISFGLGGKVTAEKVLRHLENDVIQRRKNKV